MQLELKKDHSELIGMKVSPNAELKNTFPFDSKEFAIIHSFIVINGRNYRQFGGLCKYRYIDTNQPFVAAGLALRPEELKEPSCITAPADLLTIVN